MAPDLNSLPPSSPASFQRAMNNNANPNTEGGAAPSSPSRSPRASISLQAAATMNAGLQHGEPTRRSSSGSLSRHRGSPQAGRRRSNVLMNLQLNDPALPGPGELVADEQPARLSRQTTSPQPLSGSPLLTGGDPHHNRAPSLGELHQELEAEQEAQVNRLLQMIRQQQQQLQQLQAAQGQTPSSVAAEDATPTSESPALIQTPNIPPLPTPPAAQASSSSTSVPRSPIAQHSRSSFDTSRRSRTPSRGATSPRLRSTSINAEGGEIPSLGQRDESAFYQAETQSLVRENQMLRHRIRELERQLNEAQHGIATVTHEPSQHSHLTRSTPVSGDDPARPAATDALSSGLEASKE